MRHLDAGFNLARWMLRNESDAEDIVQDSLLQAWKAFSQLQSQDGKPWFLKIVRNRCLQHLRKRKIMFVELDEQEIVQFPEANMIRSIDSERVHRAIALLPEYCREVLILREFEDMSYSEICQVVDVPIGTVMSRLSRARSMLAVSLVEDSR